MAKKQKLDPQAVDEVKALFKTYFKAHAVVGHQMGRHEVAKNILKKLDAKGDEAFAAILKEYKDEGFVEVLDDGVTLVLTKLGVEWFG